MSDFRAADGVRIAYERFGEATSRPPVLLHHGFLADCRSNFVGPGIVAALVAAGREVVGLDARGHGRSEKPHDPARYAGQQMAADVMGLADHLGWTSYDLAGYSMGAMVSLAVAARDRRVRRLVVGGVGGAAADPTARAERAAVQPALVEAMTVEDPETLPEGIPKMFRLLADALGNDRAALRAVVEGGLLPADPPELGRITAPTLVVAGADDPLATAPERLAAAIPGARLELLSGDHLSVLGDPRLAPLLVDHLAG